MFPVDSVFIPVTVLDYEYMVYADFIRETFLVSIHHYWQGRIVFL